MSKDKSYIAVYTDEAECLWCPLGWDRKNEGALEGASDNNPVVVFHDLDKAKKAIKVTEIQAHLLRELGKPYNEGYLDADNIRIWPADVMDDRPQQMLVELAKAGVLTGELVDRLERSVKVPSGHLVQLLSKWGSEVQ